VAYERTVKIASGATAVQIAHGSRRGARDIEHLGSAHDQQAVEAVMAVARQRLAGGHCELLLGWNGRRGPVADTPTTSRRAGVSRARYPYIAGDLGTRRSHLELLV
jgi:hypothetical protein